MDDATPPATPMPVPPVDTVTNTGALPPPAAPPLPVFVPPSVTDPVSNLDFLPVDDAFALELRSETIEQLVGSDALRRGVSERIEAGRSHTNADLVAGRDRVRVHGTLHEHTGHGFAEQAAHLHTTVDGVLDVHAANEDAVLLAGHMRELWDGGTAIVAAMTDDTAAGGGIRVTAPLDLWVHGLMGVEERIGTCTADAVLMELGATHYEREYGPGVHAAGLAVYTGSLYQSSRSSFRPLMRVSSGVRNLIAGGDGGGGGGSAGAGGAPAASPPPATAQTGAAAKSVTWTLAAGRRTAEVPATTLDAADALTDARRVSLEELVDSVDARVSEEMGEAGAVMRAEDLPELNRSADTAEQLRALQVTLHADAAESGGETSDGFRASEFQGAVSTNPATGGGEPLEIDPSSAVCGEKNAPIARPHSGVTWGHGPEMKLELPGGADRPPRPATPETDFIAVNRRLRELRSRYDCVSEPDIAFVLDRATSRVSDRTMSQFRKFGGNKAELAKRTTCLTSAEKAYLALQEMARQAERDADSARAAEIRQALNVIDSDAIKELNWLYRRYEIVEAPATRTMQQPSAMARPTTTVAAIPSPAHTSIQSDWITAFRRLCDLTRYFADIGRGPAHADFHLAVRYATQSVMYRFGKFGGKLEDLPALTGDVTRPEQAYRAIQDMIRRAEESDNAARAHQIRQELKTISQFATRLRDNLITKHGAYDALSNRTTRITQAMHGTQTIRTMQAMQAMQRPPATAGSPVVASTTVALAGRLDIPVPAHPVALEVTSAFPELAGGLVHTTDVPGPPPASGLPGPSLAQATGAETGDYGRSRLDPPATVSGTTAAAPAATEATVTPSLGDTSSFWLQPADPAPAPDSVPFDFGLHHAGETVQPPPVTTAPSSTAPAPGAAFHVPSWPADNFAVERRLIASELPLGFDTSRLMIDARGFADSRLVEDLAAGRLPTQTIDNLINSYRATDEWGGNTPCIEYLHAMKENIERALRATYGERADPRWLDRVREILGWHGEPVPPRAASATGPAEFDAMTEIDPILWTGEGASHPTPPPPPPAPGHAWAGAVAAPPAADPWGIGPPGMSGEPYPVAFDPWSAPPGPSTQVVYTGTIHAPVPPAGAPPGWLGAETPGFGRAASDAADLVFSHREALALRFSTDYALLQAEVALRTGGAGALGWSAAQRRVVLNDLFRLHDAARMNSVAAAAMVDVDWNVIEALANILDVPPRLP